MDDQTGNPELETPSGANQETETEHDDVDLIADELGDEDESTASDESQKEAEPQTRKLRVKIDGQELEVDEEEAAKGYQRQADYSRNMQRIQQEQAEIKQMRDIYQQRIEQYIPEQEAKLNRLAQEFQHLTNDPNLQNLAYEDPAAWAIQKQKIDDKRYEYETEHGRYQQAKVEWEQMIQERVRSEQMFSQQRLQQSEVALIQAIPEWKDPAKRQAEAPAVAKFLRESVGLSEQDLTAVNNGVFGHVPVVLARKAMQFDALMAKVAARKAGKAEETAAPAPAKSVRSSGGAAKDPDKMTADEWQAWRNKQVRAKR